MLEDGQAHYRLWRQARGWEWPINIASDIFYIIT